MPGVSGHVMDLRNLTKVALKLAGLYLISVALMGMAQLIYLPADPLGWYLMYLSAYLFAGIALYWFPGAVTNHLIRIEGAPLQGAVTPSRLVGAAILLLGVYFVASSLFSITYTVALAKLFFSATATYGGERGPGLTPEQFASIVSSSVQLIIGIALWFGWKHILRLSGADDDER